MNTIFVITYKRLANNIDRDIYGDNTLEYVYDSDVYSSEEIAKIQFEKLTHRYKNVKLFSCDYLDYSNWISDEKADKEFATTGKFFLTEDFQLGVKEKTIDIVKTLYLVRDVDNVSFDYTVDIDSIGQIVITPTNVGVRFVKEIEEETDNTRTENIHLVAQMLSDSANYDYFASIDDLGQYIITPDVEEASFISVSVDSSLNLVTENTCNECEEENDSMNIIKESRDFNWKDTLYAVVKEDGSYAGIPCLTEDEANQLSYNHDGSRVYKLTLIDNNSLEESVDTRTIADKVMRGEIDVYSQEEEPDSSFIVIPELKSKQGNLVFDYYYDPESNVVISYSRER